MGMLGTKVAGCSGPFEVGDIDCGGVYLALLGSAFYTGRKSGTVGEGAHR